MSVVQRIRAWAVRWQMALVYAAITAVFVLTVRSSTELREADARAERTAAIRLCESGNERTALIRDFMLAATADPDPRQYEFIADPVLRQGAIDQARRGRADMRSRVSETFMLRDCAAELPPPPGGG